jgi:von Willebrand factor type A domain
MSDKQLHDIVFVFDTTGSMYSILQQVRRRIAEGVVQLFGIIPNLRVGILAHGDYCDEGDPYVLKPFDLTDDKDGIVKFVNNVEPTYGGDAPECYEYALYRLRQFTWRADATRSIVMIGDCDPHPPSYHLNKLNLDWRNECKMLLEANVQVIGVHALARYRTHEQYFWKEMAEITKGKYLTFDQFDEVMSVLMAVSYFQAGKTEVLDTFENDLVASKRMTHSLADTFEGLTGRRPKVTVKKRAFDSYRRSRPTASVRRSTSSDYRKSFVKLADIPADDCDYGKVELTPVPPGRFQRLAVDTSMQIREFVRENVGDHLFVKGAGFYCFPARDSKDKPKKADVQPYKRIVLVDRETGEMFWGDAARSMLGLAKKYNSRIMPSDAHVQKIMKEFEIFIQSNSVNRMLRPGDSFLYEVKEFADEAAA